MPSPREPPSFFRPITGTFPETSGMTWLDRLVVAVDRPTRPVWLFMALVALLEFVVPESDQGWFFLLRDVAHMVLVALVGVSVTRASLTKKAGFLQQHGSDLLFFGAALGMLVFGEARAAGLIAIMRFLTSALATMTRTPRGARFVQTILERPSVALAISFSAIIVLGTVLLMSPAALTSRSIDTTITALFTATSATCVTGLSIVDIGSYYTRFGQWVIMILIQVGGLGIITLTGAMAVFMRRRLSKRAHGAVQEIMEVETIQELRTMLVGVVAITFAVEMIGAATLYPSMQRDASGLPIATPDRIFYAVFHAVSAYGNAGFGLYPDSLIRFSASVPVNVTVMSLIFLGGIGFSVQLELLSGRWIAHGPRLAWAFLSLHTKIALLMSGILVVVGTLWMALLERTHAMASMGVGEWFLVSMFQSVSLRTAGFATIDFEQLTQPTLLLCIFWMFVGGSPGGTAGGIKTTTLAIILLTVRAMMRGRTQLEVFGRSIPPNQVYRAVSVVALSGAALGFLTLLLVMVEPNVPFLPLVFEAVSAFGTVGYSVNLTPKLGSTAHLILIILMFIGRTGPFTLALALGSKPNPADYTYPPGKILVG